ncbi:MAG TPA: (Fe-S)-binding protein, partial [Lacibacter sp.]|nr:(Fe-S)-binding protein [Lacibacter sp.]
KAGEIRRNILLGVEEDLSDQPARRWKNMLLLAFGQKKMFTNPLVAVLHFLIYAGFIIINLEVLEIVLDGVLGTHRLFLPWLGALYPFLINSFEILAFLVLAACVVFFSRRNFIRIRRFMSGDLNGWPRSDANNILITEVVLMSLFLLMNAADRALQLNGAPHYADTGDFVLSGLIAPALTGLSVPTLVFIERAAWWLHILGILAFLNYLPWSKHLHILLAFPNAWYTRLSNTGAMTNMESVQKEVMYMMQPELAPPSGSDAAAPVRFGAKDVMDLSWKSLLDAYSCTECGRCSAACPANSTGKKLSPRKIMMDTRDRLEEVGRNINRNREFVPDGKTLLNDYITVEELRACTTCNACVEACPVSINPLSIILELRRSLIMEDSNAPAEWNALFSNVENNFAPWKFSPDDRDQWVKELQTAEQNG